MTDVEHKEIFRLASVCQNIILNDFILLTDFDF